MDKVEFLKMFTECLKDGDIKIVTTISGDECNGNIVTTNVLFGNRLVVEEIGDCDLYLR